MKKSSAFAKDYPEDAELRALVEAFEAGNYRRVREGTLALEKKDGDVATAARDLRSRTEPSTTQIWLLVITGLLVLTLSTYEIVMHH